MPLTHVYHPYTQAGAVDVEQVSVARNEWLLIMLTFLAVLLLNLSVTNRSIGLLLLGFLCVFSLRSPFSALLALSASQTVADPVGSPFTLTQCLFLAWGVHFLFVRRVDFRFLQKLMAWTLPYAGIAQILNLIKWEAPFNVGNFELAILVGGMAAWYVGQLTGRIHLGFVCVALGVAVSVLTFWIGVAGIGIEGITVAKSSNILEGVGVGRGDGNFSGVSISLAAIFFLAWGLLSKKQLFLSTRVNKIVPYACIGFFVLSITPVFATMSRGAVLTFLGSLLYIILSALYVSSVGKKSILLFSIIACVIGGIYFSGNFGMTQKYAESIIRYSEDQAGDSVLMSRASTWGGATEEILNSPLIGTTPETRVAVHKYGYDYASHNVWLDVGRGTGVFGMLWFTAFFFYPARRLLRFLPKSEALLFCSPFVVLFFVFMNLSLMNLKTFYILWVLSIAAVQANIDRRQYRSVNSR